MTAENQTATEAAKTPDPKPIAGSTEAKAPAKNIAKPKQPAKGQPSAKATKPTTKNKAAPKTKGSGKYRRHPANPFREGSGYGLAFDILASHKDGVVRADLTGEYAKASRKKLKNAAFDIAVLLSPKSEKPTSERHRSCREGYGIRRENSHVTLVLP